MSALNFQNQIQNKKGCHALWQPFKDRNFNEVGHHLTEPVQALAQVLTCEALKSMKARTEPNIEASRRHPYWVRVQDDS